MKKLFAILLACLFLASCGAETAVNESEPASSSSAASSVGESTPEESVPDTEEGDGTQSPDPDTEELRFENPQHAIYRDVKNELPDTEVMHSVAEKDAFFAAYLPDAGGDVYNEAFFETHTLVSVRIDPASSSREEVTAVRIGPDGALTVEINRYSSYEVTLDMVPTSVLVSVPHKLSADCKIETESTFIYAEGYGSGFLHELARYPYAGVLDTYEEWETFRTEYFPKWEDDGFYSEELFNTRKLLALAWMESHDSNRIEFAGLKPTENGAEASFVRHRLATDAVLAVCGYRIFLLDVPKDYPVESGEELSMSITEGESYYVEVSNSGEEPTPDEDWPEPEVTGISFMDIRFSAAYRDVLDTYGEWESFRKTYLPEKNYETLYGETVFDTHKVLVLAWEEGYDANKIEFVSLDWDGQKAIASFRRRRPTGAVPDVCGIKLFLLAVPKEYPAADGDDLSVTVTDIGPYEELSKPMDILEEWTNLHVETGDERPADVTVLSTYEELQAFIDRYAEGIDIGEYLPMYDELFFGHYRLAVVYCVDECGWESTRPKKLLLNPDGSLDILLRGKSPEDYGGDEPSEWLFFLWIPVRTGVDENTPIRLTVERVRLQDRIDVIYEPTREQFHAFVSQPGEDTFPWEGRKLTTAEDFIIPPTCHRWEEVAADFLCTKEGFTAYLAERGIAATVENVTYFMLMDDMPMIWLHTDKGQYFITSDFSRRDLYYTLWTEEKFCYRYMPKACKLYLNKKEMETSVPAVMYGKFAEIPLLEVLKKFGAEVTWQSDTKASVVMNGESYTLDLEEITFRHDGEGYDLLLIPPGGYGTYYPVEGDLMMSYHLLGDLMQEMGTDCVVTANFEYPAIWIQPVKK